MTPVEPRWIERLLIEAIHADLLRQHGGSGGVRDENLLESALARPRHRFAYEPAADFATLAAAYGFGLARNHPFVDGNKRTAFMAMFTFLGINGWELEALEVEVVRLMTSVAAREIEEPELAAWIRQHTLRMP